VTLSQLFSEAMLVGKIMFGGGLFFVAISKGPLPAEAQ
jgi:hypothetical protein